MKFLVLVLFFLSHLKLFGQTNLVPNPSFEDTIYCPIGTAELQSLANWFNPTIASPDYYNSCANVVGQNWGAGVPWNDWGFQYAKEGNAYGGFATIAFDGGLVNYREYIAIELSQPLIANNEYYWCFFVSLLDSTGLASNNIGVALSPSLVTDFFSQSILPVPLYGNSTELILESLNWVQIGGKFIASGGEKYLYIGNFFSDPNTNYLWFRPDALGGNSGAYYYIDDVYLGDSACFEPQIEIPNVFSPNEDGINDAFFTKNIGIKDQETIIFNRWGKVVFEGKNNLPWDGKDYELPCNEGVYYVIIQYTNMITNKKETKTGILHLVR
ncbi:MAG: gliding motility-associated C-terminal domain-containing protein [Flavobacteriales bacterium]